MAVWYQRLVWAEDDKGSWRVEDRTCGTAGKLLSHGWAHEKSSNDDPNSLLPREFSVCLRHHQRAITVAAWANEVFLFPMVWIGMAREVQRGVPSSKFLHFPADRPQPQRMHGSACFVATPSPRFSLCPPERRTPCLFWVVSLPLVSYISWDMLELDSHEESY